MACSFQPDRIGGGVVSSRSPSVASASLSALPVIALIAAPADWPASIPSLRLVAGPPPPLLPPPELPPSPPDNAGCAPGLPPPPPEGGVGGGGDPDAEALVPLGPPPPREAIDDIPAPPPALPAPPAALAPPVAPAAATCPTATAAPSAAPAAAAPDPPLPMLETAGAINRISEGRTNAHNSMSTIPSTTCWALVWSDPARNAM